MPQAMYPAVEIFALNTPSLIMNVLFPRPAEPLEPITKLSVEVYVPPFTMMEPPSAAKRQTSLVETLPLPPMVRTPPVYTENNNYTIEFW